jgi:hypothetical protein
MKIVPSKSVERVSQYCHALSSIEDNLPEKHTILRLVLRGAVLTVRGGMLALGTLREAAVVAIFAGERSVVERQETATNESPKVKE